MDSITSSFVPFLMLQGHRHTGHLFCAPSRTSQSIAHFWWKECPQGKPNKTFWHLYSSKQITQLLTLKTWSGIDDDWQLLGHCSSWSCFSLKLTSSLAFSISNESTWLKFSPLSFCCLNELQCVQLGKSFIYSVCKSVGNQSSVVDSVWRILSIPASNR